MDILANLWNASTGVGTLLLAAATFGVIRQGQRQRLDTERQHRDGFKPICVLSPYGGVDPWYQRDALIETTPPAPDHPSCGTVAIRCILRNVGVGPALKLRLRFRFPNREGQTSEPWELSPLVAGESRGAEDAPLLVPFPIHEGVNQPDVSMMTNDSWEILLEYEDVFGKQFRSIHRKAPFDMDPAKFTLTPADSGQQQKWIMPPIPWLTYHEGPMP